MRAPFKSLSRLSSRTNSVTILVVGMVLLVLGVCGIWYWRHVETQTLHLQERNFRALTVTGQALANLVANYGTVLKSVIEGTPDDLSQQSIESRNCLADTADRPAKDAISRRRVAYEEALCALPSLQQVTVTDQPDDLNGFTVQFVRAHSASSIKLTYVHQDRTETNTTWKIDAVIDIGRVMQRLVIEDIFSDVLLADRTGS